MLELAEENLVRMLRDRWRVEAGQRLLDSRLRTGFYGNGTVAAALLDLDGSGAVRVHGIEAKIQLVQQTQALIRGLVPGDALIIDSGTRDETYIVLPPLSTAADIVDLAERIRLAVRHHDFAVSGMAGPVRVTTSVGCAVIPATASGSRVFARLREALAAAKSERDCVRFLDAVPPSPADEQPLVLDVPVGTLATIERLGGDHEDVLRTGLWTLAEKHGPIWYWIGERAGALQGSIPDIRYERQSADVPTGAVAFFELLIWSVAFEAALTTRVAGGYRPELVASATVPGEGEHDLVVPLLPGEWLAGRAAAGVPLSIGDIFVAVQSARDRGASECRPLTVRLGPADLAGLDRISAARGRSRSQLLAEAVQVGADHLAAWAGRPPTAADLDLF
jgi:GGDEF domain-containing protein